MSALHRCSRSIFGLDDRIVSRELRTIIFNTMERIRCWKISQSHLAGEVYDAVDPDDYHGFCPVVAKF